MNESILTGTFPEMFKVASVRPGLKKANLDTDDFSSYRPISNLTYLSKIIEKVVHQQITDYISSNKMFSYFQSGYRKFHGCETAVSRIHNDILVMIDQKTNVVLLLLDLSAAFDTINHAMLLNRLNTYYGINDTALNWFTFEVITVVTVEMVVFN